MGLQIQVLNASTSREIDAAFGTIAREQPDALFVAGDSLFNSRRLQLALLAVRHAIPATYPSRDYPASGGLMSHGADVTDAHLTKREYEFGRLAARRIHRPRGIRAAAAGHALSGENPARSGDDRACASPPLSE